MDNLDKIENLVRSVLGELADELERPELNETTLETILFGSGGSLDSLALVHLIAELEGRVADEIGQEVIIADERAMSRSRSPFRTVGTLTQYVRELVTSDPG